MEVKKIIIILLTFVAIVILNACHQDMCPMGSENPIDIASNE